ncbi:MAG: VOC family protein [Gemmatimonadota bacterium]
MALENGRGLFLWHELMTPDPAAARGFYEPVGGWRIQSGPVGKVDYWLLMVGEQPMGGLMELPADAVNMGAPPHWMGYVGTADVDADVKRAADLGATIVVPAKDIPDVGRIAVLQDPQGAGISLFAPASEPPPIPARPPVGGFSWHELMTTELDGAWDFYTKLFGWREKSVFDMGEMGPYRIFGTDEMDLGGMFTKPAGQPGPSFWLYYARVPSVSAAAAKVKERGGTVLNGPMEVPGGDLIAQCMDPQGAMFAIHQVIAGE